MNEILFERKRSRWVYLQYHDLSAQVFDRPIQYRNGLLARGFVSYPFATRYLILPREAGRRGR
jgi:hypothetical protein